MMTAWLHAIANKQPGSRPAPAAATHAALTRLIVSGSISFGVTASTAASSIACNLARQSSRFWLQHRSTTATGAAACGYDTAPPPCQRWVVVETNTTSCELCCSYGTAQDGGNTCVLVFADNTATAPAGLLLIASITASSWAPSPALHTMAVSSSGCHVACGGWLQCLLHAWLYGYQGDRVGNHPAPATPGTCTCCTAVHRPAGGYTEVAAAVQVLHSAVLRLWRRPSVRTCVWHLH